MGEMDRSVLQQTVAGLGRASWNGFGAGKNGVIDDVSADQIYGFAGYGVYDSFFRVNYLDLLRSHGNFAVSPRLPLRF